MNPNFLWLIIPVSILIGMLITGLLGSAKIGDLMIENDMLRQELKNDETDDVHATVPSNDDQVYESQI